MSSEVILVGLEDFFNDLDTAIQQLEAGCEVAVTEAVDGTYDDSQKDVPYDAVTKHEGGYVHLKDSAEKEVKGLEGEVSYGTDHAWYVEMGTSKMGAQPYLNPAFESNAQKFVQKLKDLL
jgi:HK97 gp10 family phage protein